MSGSLRAGRRRRAPRKVQLASALAAAATVLVAATTAGATVQAWDVQSLSATETAHSVATKPPSCSDGYDGDEKAILSADYGVSVTAAGMRGRGPYAVYFPAFRGPISPGSPLAAFITATRTISETYRHVERGTDDDFNPTCTVTDTACQKTFAPRRRHTHFVMQNDGRKGVEVDWTTLLLDLPQLPCAKEFYSNGALLPELKVGQDYVHSHHPLRLFHRARQTLRLNMTRQFDGVAGDTGPFRTTYAFRGTLTSRKTVLKNDCKELHPGSGFVCTMGR